MAAGERGSLRNAPRDLKQWVEGRRLAAQRERAEEAGRPPPPEEALRRGISLWQLAHQLNPTRAAEDAEGLAFHLSWAELRRRCGAP